MEIFIEKYEVNHTRVLVREGVGRVRRLGINLEYTPRNLANTSSVYVLCIVTIYKYMRRAEALRSRSPDSI
jgi:hypothetical protein